MQEYNVKVFDNRTEWRQNGKLHRLDGPAIEYQNGSKSWYQNDKRHREDGPAVEFNDGTKEYWIDGIQFSEKEFNNRTNKKELSVAEIEQLLGYSIKIIK